MVSQLSVSKHQTSVVPKSRSPGLPMRTLGSRREKVPASALEASGVGLLGSAFEQKERFLLQQFQSVPHGDLRGATSFL